MALQQNCEYVDSQNAVVRPELMDVIFTHNAENKMLNLDLTQAGNYKILYDPKFKA